MNFQTLILIGFVLLPDFLFGRTLHENKTIHVPDGRVRYFHYYLPARLPDHSPIVILLHGGSQDYTQILKKNSAQNEWMKLSDEKKFLLIIPNGIEAGTGKADGTNQHWNDCRADAGAVETGADDVEFINNLIDWAIRKYQIDSERVYATGASNGGMMSYRLATELSHRIAAIAAFVANLPQNSECTKPARPISIFICNGTKDTWMPWNGGNIIKNGGSVLSARATRDSWIQLNSTTTLPSQTKKFNDLDPADGSIVRSELYDKGRQGTEVLFYTVKGGGHTIPSVRHLLRPFVEWIVGPQNHDMESAREAWNFLSRHTLQN